METQTFWSKYKVFILGLAGAIALSLQELLSSQGQETGEINYKVFAYAALMAGLSYIATQWRGKNVSIAGIVGTLAGVFVEQQQAGDFNWNRFIMYSIVAVLAVVSPPPKPSTYEHDETIVKAKEVPPVDPVSDNTDLPIGGSNSVTK